MGRLKTRRQLARAGVHTVHDSRNAATHIEQTLQALILTAEQADLRFLGYLLRMARLEAGGVEHRRAE